MRRKLFCEISPFTYKISTAKCIVMRSLANFFARKKFARERSETLLPAIIYSHNSLIRRRLGNVDMELQENKAVNLSLAVPKISGILIRPNETFSFWSVVGSVSRRKGYREGLTINGGKPSSGTGGGMCQLTNLIHWMVLHSPLTITEHHHHDGLDLFPDHNRQIPFGTGTSILHNYLDYRFRNDTDMTFQLVVYVTEEYLCGEIRAEKPLQYKYHIKSEGERFVREGDAVYREGCVYREIVDVKTGNHIEKTLIRENHARVLYDTSELDIFQ